MKRAGDVADSSNVGQNFKYGILVWLTLQNSIHVLIVRYSRSRPVQDMFFASCAVFWTEVVKLIICLLAVLFESGGIHQ